MHLKQDSRLLHAFPTPYEQTKNILLIKNNSYNIIHSKTMIKQNETILGLETKYSSNYNSMRFMI